MDLASAHPRRCRAWVVAQNMLTACRQGYLSFCSLFVAESVLTVLCDSRWRSITIWQSAGVALPNYQSIAEGTPEALQSFPRRLHERLVGPLVRSAQSPERMRSECDKANTGGATSGVVAPEYAISIRGEAVIFHPPEYPKAISLVHHLLLLAPTCRATNLVRLNVRRAE